jgi:hypothetical protein
MKSASAAAISVIGHTRKFSLVAADPGNPARRSSSCAIRLGGHAV